MPTPKQPSTRRSTRASPGTAPRTSNPRPAAHSARVFNFSPGPGALPLEVLEQAAAELMSWRGSGMSVMEMSHRSAEFEHILAEARADLRTLLAVPDNFHILFMQGGALAQNAIVPLNLMYRGDPQRPAADFVITGTWSMKSESEARQYGSAHIAASNLDQARGQIPAPASWNLHDDAAYLHLCSNETIAGIEFDSIPDLGQRRGRIVVADMSSNLLSRPVDFERVAALYAGAQKNVGPAGLTIVIARDDLLGFAHPHCPWAFDWQRVASAGSQYNTPPTYAIYIAGLVFQWLRRQGGIAAIERQNRTKAALLYACIDRSQLYVNQVHASCRSRMNVPFLLRDTRLDQRFVAAARAHGLVNLEGHRAVGGMRASLYNAMPLEGVQALVQFMAEFERTA